MGQRENKKEAHTPAGEAAKSRLMKSRLSCTHGTIVKVKNENIQKKKSLNTTINTLETVIIT